MPEGRFKSRTYRRIQKKLPGARTVLRYEKKAVGKAICASCGEGLKGVPSKRVSEMQKIPKSKRAPQRPFGGNLCTRCARAKIKSEARKVVS